MTAEQRVMELEKTGIPQWKIAQTLNKEGFRTVNGKLFKQGNVSRIMRDGGVHRSRKWNFKKRNAAFKVKIEQVTPDTTTNESVVQVPCSVLVKLSQNFMSTADLNTNRDVATWIMGIR